MASISEGYISGRTFKDKLVKYEKIDDLAIFEGDIILGKVDDLKHSKQTRGILRSVVVSGEQRNSIPNCRQCS
jgi:hypothetical protein